MPPKSVRIEIKGVEAWRKECRKFAKDGEKTLMQLIFESATTCHKLAVDLIRTGPRTGHTYFKTKAKIPHVASAPGEPPKSDTGTLIQNITLEKDGPKTYTVGSRKGAPWGFWLEYGTSNMKARPWLSVAFEKMKEAMRGKYG